MNTFKTCAAIFLIAFPVLGTAKVRVTHLTVNYLQNPLGIDELPKLSWQMQSDERGISQTAYQIQVAASKEDLAKKIFVYDSGKIFDSHSVQMPYHGPLQPATRYYYKVRVWDNHNRESESKEDSWFETGLGVADQQAWCGAQWIGSSRVLLSPYRSTFIVDYDTEDTSAFIFGKRGDMYCQVALKGGQLKVECFFIAVCAHLPYGHLH